MTLDALRKMTALLVIGLLLCASFLLRRVPSPSSPAVPALAASAARVMLWQGPRVEPAPASLAPAPAVPSDRRAAPPPLNLIAVEPAASEEKTESVVSPVAPEAEPALLAGRALQVNPAAAAAPIDALVPAPDKPGATTRGFQNAGRSVVLAFRRTGGAIRAAF